MTALIVLRGRQTSVVLETQDGGIPVWRHWGAIVEAGRLAEPWAAQVPRPSFSLDENQPFRLVPVFGRGWMGPSALQCHREGLAWAPGRSVCRTAWGDHALDCCMEDAAMGIRLDHSIALDPATDVLTLCTRLTNTADRVLDVSWLAAGTLPLPPQAQSVESFSGRHNREFMPVSDTLTRSTWRRENRRGLTSHDCPSVATVLGAQAGPDSGPVWAAQLAWSGNHIQSIDWHDDGRWIWMAGEWLAPGEVRLQPGESLASPDWIATYSPDGWNGAAQNFHAAIRRRSPLWRSGSLKPRPVHINTWEALYFDHKEADLMSLADEAAALGVERFVLDDGWFKGRKNDTRSLGDWSPDIAKYPLGLRPLADHVTALGMEFGLWVEPEMVNPDSDLFRRHPEWILRLDPDLPLTARNQLVLDLTRQDVRRHLFDVLDGLLHELPISYLKWDHNRDLTEAGASGRPAYRRQVLGVYELMDRLMAAHPHLEIESCAGGGGRIDAGMLTRAHRVWTSDNLDAVSRLDIQGHFLRYFPPEIMGAHIGASPAHATGRSQALSFRAAVAATGHFGLELDPRLLTAADRLKVRDWITFYKSIRAQVQSGRVWNGITGDAVAWLAFGSPTDAILFIYRLQPSGLRYPPAVCLPFVLPDKTYSLRRIDPGPRFAGNGESVALKAPGDGLDHAGSWLREIGFQLPFMKAESSMILRVQAD